MVALSSEPYCSALITHRIYQVFTPQTKKQTFVCLMLVDVWDNNCPVGAEPLNKSAHPQNYTFKRPHLWVSEIQETCLCRHNYSEINLQIQTAKSHKNNFFMHNTNNIIVVQRVVLYLPAERWRLQPLWGLGTGWWHHRSPGHSGGSWYHLWSKPGRSRWRAEPAETNRRVRV